MGLLDDAIREHLELKRRRGADAGEVARLETEALGPVRRSAEGVPEMADTFDSGEDAEEEAGAPPPFAHDRPSVTPPPTREAADLAPPPEAATRREGLGADPSPVIPPPTREDADVDPPPLATPPGREPLDLDPPPATPPPAREPVSYEPPPLPPPPAREPWKPESEPEPPADEAEQPPSLFSRLRPGRRHKRGIEPEEPEQPSAGDRDREPYDRPASPPVAYPDAPPPAAHEPDIVPADDEPGGEDLLEETPEFLEETPEHDRLWFEQRPPRDFNFDD
ncbi:MAG TPA: hypothetical protein VNT54_06820 [Solirubrobacteraceae bacterium]|nr:hypothetical protein [Solirubrobacteraceae bacterium]